jgi:hypothetical protein
MGQDFPRGVLAVDPFYARIAHNRGIGKKEVGFKIEGGLHAIPIDCARDMRVHDGGVFVRGICSW